MTVTMHYWPGSGRLFGCDTDAGLRTSAVNAVTCPNCLTGLDAGREAAELQAVADETGETLETVRDLHEAMQVCGSEGDDEARAERRSTAREAGLDAAADVVAVPDAGDRLGNALDDAIEAATRVRVDADLTQAVRDAHPDLMIKTTEIKSMIEVAFRAAGFEVEQ